MDEVTQVRCNNWTGIFHARKESGLTVRDWCSQNNVSIHAYYYWLRKLRKQALQDAGITSGLTPVASPQLVKVPDQLLSVQSDAPDEGIALRIQHGNDLIEVGNQVSDRLLSFLREVILSC